MTFRTLANPQIIITLETPIVVHNKSTFSYYTTADINHPSRCMFQARQWVKTRADEKLINAIKINQEVQAPAWSEWRTNIVGPISLARPHCSNTWMTVGRVTPILHRPRTTSSPSPKASNEDTLWLADRLPSKENAGFCKTSSYCLLNKIKITTT